MTLTRQSKTFDAVRMVASEMAGQMSDRTSRTWINVYEGNGKNDTEARRHRRV